MENHESRCAVFKFQSENTDSDTADIGYTLRQEMTAINILPMCIITPYEDSPLKAFVAFKSGTDKEKACKNGHIKLFSFEDIQPGILIAGSYRINIKPYNLWRTTTTEKLKEDLEASSGVNVTINEMAEVYISGCKQQINLAESMLEKRYNNPNPHQTGGQSDGEECSICLEIISNRKTLPCGHSFCQLCIDLAMKTSICCPNCRKNVHGRIQTQKQQVLHMTVQTTKDCHVTGQGNPINQKQGEDNTTFPPQCSTSTKRVTPVKQEVEARPKERLPTKSISLSSGEYLGGARPKEATASRQYKKYNIKKSVFQAINQIIGKEIVRGMSHSEQRDGSLDFYLPEPTTDKTILKIKDLIEDIRHEEVKIPEYKFDEACEFSWNHDYKESVYVGVDDDTSTVHILGVNFHEVEEIVYKFKIAVGLVTITNKKQQRTRDDSFSSLPQQTELQEQTYNTPSKNIKVIVKKSDITKLNVDVIVNGAYGYTSHGGGVAYFISKAGRYRQIPVTGICKTTGGNMRCKKVYHAVGPRWDDYRGNKKDCEDDLCKTIIRCLVEADKDGYKSIAIPSISSAIFGVPKPICIEMYVRAVHSFDNLHNVINLREIYFVDVQKDMVLSIQGGFEMFLKNPLDDLQKQTLGRMIEDISVGTRYGDINSATSSQSKPDRSDVAQSQESQVKMVIKEQESKTYMICYLNPDFSIHMYQADAVTSSKTDAITTWEDTQLSNFNANTKILIKGAGQSYEDERTEIKTKNKNMFKAGSVITTSAGSLPFKYIFHLVSSIKPKEEELESLICNLFAETRKTSVNSVTTVNGNVDTSVLLDVLLKQLQENIKLKIPSTLKEIHLVVKSEENMTELSKLHQNLIHQEDDEVGKDEECSICMEVISERKNLPCGHSFCGPCIDQAIKSSIFCPICRKNVYGGIQTGTQPEGHMKVTTNKYSHLPGYEKYGTIEINYIFRDGIQSEKHPNPGKPFKGTTRTAYLPDNRDGQEVLSLLKTGWDRRLIFTVGKSVTTGQNDVVTWNDIPIKTRKHGGPDSYGYPDHGYLNRVKEELMAHGVTSEKPR
ncbi:uncharacterized protein LOC126816685 [Patella vulgata]|uniref:uncharacterized protein LOC126816685 n=1 Tax=Patella vulgata TaxID=6465 RepID=UPI002180287D|nr:uncharacterized protein LOC126816685 [Patella vulgata]